MFFNLNHEILIDSVRESIGVFGSVKFQNALELSVNNFLELIRLYLLTSVIKENDRYFTQISGICIGSKIASNLSDLFVARINRKIQNDLVMLNPEKSVRIMKYVDDYLVVALKNVNFDLIDSLFEKYRESLVFTHEKPNNQGELQYLDLSLSVTKGGICWCFRQRSNKA